MAGNGWGEEFAGDERAWLRGRLRTANGKGELRGRLRTAWVPGSGWKWVMEKSAGDERAWLRGRLRTANGLGELRGWGNGWGEEALVISELAARTAADGKWVRRIARTAADGVGATEWRWGEEAAGDERAWLRARLRTGNGCGELRGRLRTAWVQGICWKWVGNVREKKPLVTERGQQMGAENCADSCGRRGCQGVAGNGWGEEAAGDERAWLRGCCGREKGAENCADGCGRRGCQGVAGNWWGEEAAGDQRAWLRGRLRTATGCGELRGRLRTAWVLEMLGEKKPLVMSELGCAENCADGCGRRGCEGVAGNGWGEEAAGDERAWLRTGNGWGEEAAGDGRAWLRGRLRTANGWGELRRRLRTAWVPGSTWRAGGGYKYIARLEHLYNLLKITKCCNLPYKWC